MTPPLQPAVRGYRPSDRDALVSLWSRCGLVRPWNDPRRDIERKLAHDPGGLLEAHGCLAGSVMAGYDGHRGWVNYLAVDPAWQGRGFGRLLMTEAEQRLLALGCPKVNLQVRASNERVVAFYRHLGYGTDDVVSLGRRRRAMVAAELRTAGLARRCAEHPDWTAYLSAGIKRIPAQIRQSSALTADQPQSLRVIGTPAHRVPYSCRISACQSRPARLALVVQVGISVAVTSAGRRVRAADGTAVLLCLGP
jgi:GNAT superfamily N-acetyltransferase